MAEWCVALKLPVARHCGTALLPFVKDATKGYKKGSIEAPFLGI